MSQANRGIIDAGGRMIGELMEKTAFKDSLRALLQNIDPENGPQLVRTVLEKDIEVPLSIVSSLPGIANTLILMADELIRQVLEKFPPPLLTAFIESLLAEIDREALARVIEGSRQIVRDLSPVFREAIDAAGQERTARTIEGVVQ
ncbi:MAG TPA: hypothetical protein PLF54_01625 [Deltaproteobacteria bacterium]|jgi:hypothetical protein|nr:hypothetical protein [Deltaproteobacteria bacterium]